MQSSKFWKYARMCPKTSRQGAGGPRLFAKKKNASALWIMMANEEMMMETVMLTITVTNETSKQNTLLWQIEYWGQELFTLVQKYMCLYVYSTQFVFRQFFCNFLVLALLRQAIWGRHNFVYCLVQSALHFIRRGGGEVSINLFSIFSDNFWVIYMIDERVFFMDKIYRKIFVGLY